MTDFLEHGRVVSVPGSGGWVDRLLTRWCAGRPTRDIRINGQPYLLRVYVCHWRGWRVYLHRFVSADGDRYLHDHPFHGLALVLSGGYTEERMRVLDLPEPVVRLRRVRGLNWLPARTFHRIARVLPGTWTLFINTPHRKRWGFLIPMALDVGEGLVYTNPADVAHGHGTHWWSDPTVPKFSEVQL